MIEHEMILRDLREYLILKSIAEVSKNGDTTIQIEGRATICLESSGWIVMHLPWTYFDGRKMIKIASIADPRYREKTLNVVDSLQE